MTDGVDRCITDLLLGVEDRGGCWNDDGDAGQEQQGTGGLVHCGTELLLFVLDAANQEAAACKAHVTVLLTHVTAT